MSFPNDQSDPAGAIPTYSAGSALIVPTPPTPFPATIAAGATYDTGAISTRGCQGLSASAKLDQTGTLTMQRYIDPEGTIPIGAAITQAMVANTQESVYVRDGLPAASFRVTIHNTSGSLGHLTSTALLITG